MQKYRQFLITLALVTFLTVVIQPWGHLHEKMSWPKGQTSLEQVMAQEASESDNDIGKSDSGKSTNVQEQVTPDNDKSDVPVIVDGEKLFSIKVNLQELSPRERVERLNQRIIDVAQDYSQNVDSIEAKKIATNVFLIMSGEKPILIMTQDDAEAANQPLDKLSSEYANKIKAAIVKYRQQRSFRHLLWSAINTILSLAAFIIIIKTIAWIYKISHSWLTNFLQRTLHPQARDRSAIGQWLEAMGWDLFKFSYVILKLTYWIIVLTVIYLFIPLILSFFPWTQKLSDEILDGLSQALKIGWSAFLDYLPNLLIIVLTIAIVYLLNKFFQELFRALGNGAISLPGFYPDWAKPTYKLTVFLMVAFTVAIIYPYLPGGNSPSFHGVSIFIGALLTIGGASTVGNIVGGLIIIYTRAYQIGDRIKIADTLGDVVEKTVFSTRICTIDNEVVTIPNATMISSNIVNYSAMRRDFKRPLLLHTTITLGYDVPWRKIYQTLVAAANATSDILKEPAPFVVQTSLDDFYVSYQLKAYTDRPSRMVNIYSELYENIQDKCNEVGIEIMSPHYSALRDGNHNTIPEDYLPQDYQTPGFLLDRLKQKFNETDNSSHPHSS